MTKCDHCGKDSKATRYYQFRNLCEICHTSAVIHNAKFSQIAFNPEVL